MWYLIVLGVLLLVVNWLIPSIAQQGFGFLWMVGAFVIIIGILWLVINARQKKVKPNK